MLLKAYATIKIGDPLEEGTLCGPLHTTGAIKEYLEGIEEIKKQGGKILHGGKRINRDGYFVEPTLVAIDKAAKIMNEELFVPILYLVKFDTIEEAIQINN